MSGESTFQKRRLRSSYITSVVSISMVLFMLGLMGLLLIHARKLTDITRESFTVSIFFRDSVDDAQIREFEAELASAAYVKSTAFTSKAQAAQNFSKDLGEDFVDFLGFNPLPASIDVNFKPEFANETYFAQTEKEWLAHPLVEQVSYPRNLITKISANMQNLSWFFLAFGAVLTLIAVTLINNTIRLAIYSKRFLIKTMLLVGAKASFVRGPFLRTGILQGFIGGLVALILLAGVMVLAENKIPELRNIRDLELLGMLSGAVVLGGIVLSWICTFFAVRKYLNLKTDSLY